MRRRVVGEVEVRIVLVEVPRDLFRQNADKLAAELLGRFVSRRNTAVCRIENLGQFFLPDDFSVVVHVMYADDYVRLSLIQRGTFVQIEIGHVNL